MSKRKKTSELITDPVLSAKAAGLRYVSDAQPGIYRKRRGKGVRYVDADGVPVRDKDTLARIQSLVQRSRKSGLPSVTASHARD